MGCLRSGLLRGPLASLLWGLAVCGGLRAQSAPDVGLTLDLGPTLPAFVGYDCGAFSCAAVPAGLWAPGASRTFTGYGAPASPWVVVGGLPGFCLPVGGIANALIPAPPLFVMHVGSLGPVLPGSPCAQGAEKVPFTMPAGAPTGFVLCIQNAALSPSLGQLAFGPALDVIIS